MFGSCGIPGPVMLLISRATPAKAPMVFPPKAGAFGALASLTRDDITAEDQLC